MQDRVAEGRRSALRRLCVALPVAAGAAALAVTVGGGAAAGAGVELPGDAGLDRGRSVGGRATNWEVGLKRFKPFKGSKQVSPNGYGIACSAAVIGPKLVVTAAHCIDDLDLKRVTVSVGVDDISKTVTPKKVAIARVWAP